MKKTLVITMTALILGISSSCLTLKNIEQNDSHQHSK